MLKSIVPILRIFDENKAREFYLEYLGFQLDWEHRFEQEMPLYMQVSLDSIVIRSLPTSWRLYTGAVARGNR